MSTENALSVAKKCILVMKKMKIVTMIVPALTMVHNILSVPAVIVKTVKTTGTTAVGIIIQSVTGEKLFILLKIRTQ